MIGLVRVNGAAKSVGGMVLRGSSVFVRFRPELVSNGHYMDTKTISLIALGILALVVIAFFAVFRGRGTVQLKGLGVDLNAKGENPPPPAAVPAGVKIKDTEAGRDLIAHSTGPGGVDLEKVKAKGDIEAKSTQAGLPPPKS